MKQADFDAFNGILTDCLSMWSGAPNASVTAIWFRALSAYELPTLSAAFSAHMRDPANGKYEPKPAHIIDQIDRAAKNDGRPGPEEAWAISVAARSEDETIVWTSECSQAWATAKPIMDMGDEVGARMAFRESYVRLVEEARTRGEAATWDVSEGFDKDRRRIAVSAAIEAGRIPAGSHLALEQGSALLLESSKHRSGVPPEIREQMAALRAMFTKDYSGPSEADAERQRLADLKREQQAKVDQFQQGRPT